MPIYEFYCEQCNTIFSFFSKSVNTDKIPACPQCQQSLERRMSIFAPITKGKGASPDGNMPPVDDEKMMGLAQKMAGDARNIDPDDPKQAAALMRKLRDETGLDMGRHMDEVLRRMEKGEDPEKIERDMGDLMVDNEFLSGGKGKGSKKGSPIVDEKLYDL